MTLCRTGYSRETATALVFDNVASVTGYSTDFAFYNVISITEAPKIVTVDNVTSVALLFH